jgi:uroporphyrinogen-III synthase
VDGADQRSRNFGGLTVAAFESRRAKEMATLITNYGGIAEVAPSMREIPLEENSFAFAFADRLFGGDLDAVIFMTGVGAETLMEVLETRYPRERIVQALSKLFIVARGPKPWKVLRALQIPAAIVAPEPNTWREILIAWEEGPYRLGIKGSRIAVQEYGVPNREFLEQLARRGAKVLEVPVYRWGFPEDLAPLRRVLNAIVEGRARLILFTNATQLDHVLRVAAEHGIEEKLRESFRRCIIGSIGPTCSEAIINAGLSVDFEPSHPKMGQLVHEAAAKAAELLKRKSGA